MRCMLLLFMLLFPLYDVAGQSYFGVMTYNCENAFDTIHDEGHDDLEYTPNGLNSWKRNKFYNKIRNISKVIMSADSIQPVDLQTLQPLPPHLKHEMSASTDGSVNGK